MNALQSSHAQLVGFHFFFLFLKTCRAEVLFNSSGSTGQMLPPKFDTVSVPQNFLEARRIPLFKL